METKELFGELSNAIEKGVEEILLYNPNNNKTRNRFKVYIEEVFHSSDRFCTVICDDSVNMVDKHIFKALFIMQKENIKFTYDGKIYLEILGGE